MRVLVVGAGIVGACIARNLARRGAAVTVLEASRPAGGTTLATVARVTALGRQPQHYFELNLAGVAEHLALVRELGGGEWHHPVGDIEWTADADALRAKVEKASSAGYRGELMPASTVRELEPDAAIGDDQAAARYPDDAWVDPVLLVRRLLDHPAITLSIGEAVSFTTRGDTVSGVVRADGEAISVDSVVIATGPRAAELASAGGLDLPMRHAPGLLAITEPAALAVRHLIHAPGVAIRPDGAGRLLLASDELDKNLDLVGGDLDVEAAAQELLARARRALSNLDGVKVEAKRIGLRALTSDGMPAIGPLPGRSGAYLAVMHSGVTLAPLVGRLVADEILDAVPNPMLEPYRPTRFSVSSQSS